MRAAPSLLRPALAVVAVLLAVAAVRGDGAPPAPSGNDTQNQFYYDTIHTIRVEGNATMMYYYVNVYVGLPPQRQTLIVDTGSYLMAFPCSDCGSHCGHHIDKQFDAARSKTARGVRCGDKFGQFTCQNCDAQRERCRWDISYAEGSSLHGYVMRDYVTLGDEIQQFLDRGDDQAPQLVKFVNHERIEMAFGCTTSETKLFLTQEADGIMGLSPGTNTTQHMPNIIDENFRQHKNNHEKLAFSLCFGAVTGGYMSVGGYNTHRHLDGATTHIIDYHDSDGFYGVDMYAVKMDGIDIGIPAAELKNPFIDSGTTLFFGPQDLIMKLYNKFSEICRQNNRCRGDLVNFSIGSFRQICYRYNPQKAATLDEFFASFPTLSFTMQGGYDYQWYPRNYFFIDPEHTSEHNLWCLGFEPYPASRVYLGGTWMREHDILFDRENRKIHITPANCSEGAHSAINDQFFGNQIDQGGKNLITTPEDEYLINKFVGQSYGNIIAFVIGTFIIVPVAFFACHYVQRKRQLMAQIVQTQDAYVAQDASQARGGGARSASGRRSPKEVVPFDAHQLADDESADMQNARSTADEEAPRRGSASRASYNKAQMRDLDDKLESEEQNEYGYQNKDVEYAVIEEQALNESVDEMRRVAFED